MKTWFVTGSSSGFGLEIAKEILSRGDNLVATARDVSKLGALVEVGGERVRAVELDVTRTGEAERAIGEGVKAFGRIDVVINNAGYGLLGALEECDDGQIARNFETNFFGALRVMRAAVPIFKAQRYGRFINMSAAAAISNYAGFSVYGAAKCALEGLSESVALELASFGVRVTIVQPGPFRTDFIARSMERGSKSNPDYNGTVGAFAKVLEKVNGRQPGDPARAAKIICGTVDDDAPPMRLVLAKYAVGKVRKKIASLDAELSKWEASGVWADYPPGT